MTYSTIPWPRDGETPTAGYQPPWHTVTLDDASGAPTITTSQLTVAGHVPGIDEAAFRDAAERAGAACPVSRALAGVDITVNTTLSQQH